MLLGVMWMMTALVVGFMIGRISMYGLWDGGEPETEDGRRDEGKKAWAWMKKGHRQEDNRQSWSVGSPVPGQVAVQEGEYPTVIIYPDADKLYAPASGKISRLFPMGNSFCFTTDFGAELYIQVGDADDELLERYYRPRVLRNEVVEKGKLLLEFDRKGLESEGVSAEVSVCVEQAFYGGEIRMTADGHVSVGEELMQILEPSGQAAVTAG